MPITTSPRDWLDYVSALTPSVIALVVAYLAYRQWRIAKQKLRLDLYAKRFAVFEIALHFYQDLLDGSGSSKEDQEMLHRQFITAMIECRFLFASNSGLKGLMEEMNKSAFVIKGSRDVLKTQGIPSEMFQETMNRLHTEQASLEKKIQSIQTAMAPYLSFHGLVD
jgi:hypothetical protein